MVKRVPPVQPDYRVPPVLLELPDYRVLQVPQVSRGLKGPMVKRVPPVQPDYRVPLVSWVQPVLLELPDYRVPPDYRVQLVQVFQ
jgi:hypothetical protein